MMFREPDLIDEIKFVHPQDVQDGKIELSIMDARTGLGRFHDFRISNYDLICNRQSGAVKHSGCRFLFIYSMDV